MVCSNGLGEVPLYRVDGVPRGVIGDDDEHGDPGEVEHGRGHGGALGGAESVTRYFEQQTVVKYSVTGHASVISSVDGRRRARLLRVEIGRAHV